MIDILLATYNGERHLPTQLDSLFAQTYQNFTVTALDDASTDRTPEILAAYAKKYPGRLNYSIVPEHTGDPSRNFFTLLAGSSRDYVMFCDQDDIWALDKVRLSLREMQRQEETDPQRPVLVHTNLEVVSEDLGVISHSFMRYEHLDPAYRSLPRLIVQNNVTGCTILMNRPLRNLVQVPQPIFMHDWWLALTASAFGIIAYVKDATVLYRQHSANAVGAKNVRSAAYAADRLRSGSAGDSLRRSYAMAKAFRETYGPRLSPEQLTFLRRYEESGSGSLWERFRTLTRYRAYKKGLGRKLAQIFLG